jgi:hypothetical protein
MTPVAAELLEGGRVVTQEGRTLGRIEDVMVDLQSGAIAYALLEAEDAGRYAVPWKVLRPASEAACFVIDAPGLEAADGVQRVWPW